MANAVLAARSALGHACRNGSPEEITAAREALALAKAERLRADAAALEDAVAARDEVRIIGYASEERPDRKNHAALLDAQYVECREVRRSLPPDPEEWTKEDRQTWAETLRRHTLAHEALGCSATDPCRFGRS